MEVDAGPSYQSATARSNQIHTPLQPATTSSGSLKRKSTQDPTEEDEPRFQPSKSSIVIRKKLQLKEPLRDSTPSENSKINDQNSLKIDEKTQKILNNYK
jgi:hypothetical protein